jgi:hypothetical protein
VLRQRLFAAEVSALSLAPSCWLPSAVLVAFLKLISLFLDVDLIVARVKIVPLWKSRM